MHHTFRLPGGAIWNGSGARSGLARSIFQKRTLVCPKSDPPSQRMYFLSASKPMPLPSVEPTMLAVRSLTVGLAGGLSSVVHTADESHWLLRWAIRRNQPLPLESHI